MSDVSFQEIDCALLLHIERESQDDVAYVLYAAVVHNGSDAQCGHYYTIARHSSDAHTCYRNFVAAAVAARNENKATGALKGGNWYKFDDANVTRSSHQHLVSLPFRDTVYMLFYLRVGD